MHWNNNLIAVKNCQTRVARKDLILLSNIAVILYRASSHTAFKDKHIKFTILAGTYSISNFNGRVEVAVLKER